VKSSRSLATRSTGEWVAREIQALIDDQQLEIFFIGNRDQLLQAAIECCGALPADNKAFDAEALAQRICCCINLPVVAGIRAELRDIGFGAIPGFGIEQM